MHMKIHACLALAVASLSLVTASESSDVHQLTKDTFKKFVEDNDLVLAEFFAPWCGHCKALAPEYEVAATKLKEKNIPLAKVDCTEEADLCQEHGIEGYPTLKVFRGPSTVSPYGGQRKADAIVSYMTKQSMPAVSDLTKDTFEAFKTADKIVMVAFFDAKDKASNETFTKVANKLRDNYLFGATVDASLAKVANVKVPGIVLFKTFDDPVTTYDGAFESDAIESFLKTESTPLVGEVGPETYSGYMESGLPLAYIFEEEPEKRQEFAKEFKELAVKYKGKINIATIDAKAFGQHGANLNLEVGKWPAFAIQDTVKNKKYPFDQSKELTVKAAGEFLQDFADGKIEPSIKSEAVPENQDGPVSIIVAKNYEEIVMDDKKDVLVEFYAPWCGHCKALAPKYDELGLLYKNDPELAKLVTIAKVDATANDVPDEIQGFPTIKLFPAGKKGEPVEYNGSRTIEDLIQFIKENGANKAEAKMKAPESSEDAETIGKAAPAATDKAEEGKSETKEEVKDEKKDEKKKDEEVHDEL